MSDEWNSVERAALRAHALVARPGLGNHHQDRVRQRPARHDEELEHVVERGGVAAPLADDRQDLPEIVAEQVGDMSASRAFIQLMLPRSVLISPLCAT